MNKKFKYYAIVWAILLAVFNVICFVTPGEAAGMSKFGGAFWAGYIFITIAFIGQLVCAYIALKTDDKTKLFYNIPIIRISYTGLILTVVFGALCMAIPNLPNWVGIIVCVLVLAFTAIAVIKAKAASDVVENIDKKVKAQTMFVKSLTVDAESLLARAKTAKQKPRAVRYSRRCAIQTLYQMTLLQASKAKSHLNSMSFLTQSHPTQTLFLPSLMNLLSSSAIEIKSASC